MTRKEEHTVSRVYTYDPSGFALANLFYSSLAGEYRGISDYRIERECYESFLIMQVLDGELTVQAADKKQIAKSNSFVFLDCRVPHCYQSAAPVSFRWMHLQGASTFAYCDLLHERFDNPGIMCASALVRQEYEMLFGLLQSDSRLEHSASVQIHRMLGALAEGAAGGATSTKQALVTAASFLRENYMKTISIGDAAEVAHMSVYHFTRQFHKQHGVSPYEYLTMQRIANAKHLLLTTRKSTKQIAQECGFQSASTFIHSFRTRTQMTPSQFRTVQI